MPAPDALAVSGEEASIVWRALEELPEQFREPLVLFYREEQSAAAVATALDLSEDAVKQRLSRGRALLREQLASLVADVLAKSRPGAAFTGKVLMLLPNGVLSSEAAATAAAKYAGAFKSVWSIALTGLFIGPLSGLLGAGVGLQFALHNLSSSREQAFVRRFSRALMALETAFAVVLALLVWIRRLNHAVDSSAWALWLGGWVVLFLCSNFMLVAWGVRQQYLLRREISGGIDVATEPVANLKDRPGWNYTSRARLLGFPLVHVAGTSVENGVVSRGFAKGWIAVGDAAFGILFASGGVAVGGIAFGGVSIGLLSMGALSMGLVALGGCALGGAAFGGLAIGWTSFGAGAFAWRAAEGGVALAKDYALGWSASAAHANDVIARTWISQNRFFASFPLVTVLITYFFTCICSLFGIVPLAHALINWIAKRKNTRQGS